ncbi:MAG: NAD+ synthase [Verrucomicrobiae bacterium]|nr:NAD+ synthase [Verrucomicrobiae bacterium]
MRLALAQINTTVGDLAGNEARILDAYRRAATAGVELVVMPELALTGYPPRDLLLRPSFVDAQREILQRLAAATGPVGLLVGFVGRNPRRPGRELTNSAALLADGGIVAVQEKTLLPTYDVFDEDRYFEPAIANEPVSFRGRRLGITICEDLWNDEDFWPERRYRPNPAAALAEAGAEVILNLSASPWHLRKEQTRHAMLSSLAAKTGRPVVYCNLVGGNDELVFDGQSVVYRGGGALIAQGAAFAEDLLVVDTEAGAGTPLRERADEAQLHDALVLGTRDYLQKCGFRSAVLGLSGGIDSAVVAALAVAALGPEQVRGLALPSEFSSSGSLSDARALAENLGIAFDIVPIQPTFAAIQSQLQPLFAGRPRDTTEENLQARLRGVTLMAMSNKFGSLLLTTGNKSELAVGYCTLYGDMCGGLAVISDVPKTWVYRLARWMNADALARGARPPIPEGSLTKPPSAELRPNQTDQDSLPPYDVLDAILDGYVVRAQSVAELVAEGWPEAEVRRVIRLIEGSEYKRRQAAPGLKVTTKAFGVGRRVPIAQRWREV